MTRTAALLAAALPALGCSPVPVPEAFPQDAADAWLERYAAQDAAGVAALYTEDAQLLPPDAETVTGRAAIQEFVARTNRPGGAALEIATIETHVFGDWAHRQGRYVLRAPGDAESRGATGKFMELWRKVDGRWLIHREIWNADAPPPPASADGPADEPA